LLGINFFDIVFSGKKAKVMTKDSKGPSHGTIIQQSAAPTEAA
jgi:hypothetical protein